MAVQLGGGGPPPMPPPPHVVVRLAVEVVGARDLVPKDGAGTCSAYAVVSFDGQRKRTSTVPRDLNPQFWHERHEFTVSDPASMRSQAVDVSLYHDRRFDDPSSGGGRSGCCKKKHLSLGHVRVYGSEFSRGGDAAGVVYLPLKKKRNRLTSPRGEVGLKIYYYDDPAGPPPMIEEPPADNLPDWPTWELPEDEVVPPEQPEEAGEAVQLSQSRLLDLVEKMPYLFVRVVSMRGTRACESPYVKVQTGPYTFRTPPGRDVSGTGYPEWNQVFAISLHGEQEPTLLEISVWDGGALTAHDAFLGGVLFDLTDVPVREQPDGLLALQWHQLEGPPDRVMTGDIMLAVWIGTQADEAFPEAWSTDAPYSAYTRSNVYQSPKLWYLRASVIEARDIRMREPPPGLPVDVRVKVVLGFQTARTQPAVAASSGASGTFAWSEEFIFVASEPLDDHLVVLVEDRSENTQPLLLGRAVVPVGSIEERLDERRLVRSLWLDLQDDLMPAGSGVRHGPPGFSPIGRIHLRLCLEGGYHVFDEEVHVCSDYRPTSKQLWKPPVGVLELGIIGAGGLVPVKPTDEASYCVAKYGKKWVRTRTIYNSLHPRWNERYTWQVYDPFTVLTVAVFDNRRMRDDLDLQAEDVPLGKVQVHLSTLESNRVHTATYPLMAVGPSTRRPRKMGELQLALRFSPTTRQPPPDTWAPYTSSQLPPMHYRLPIGVLQQGMLRGAAVRSIVTRLARSEPPLGPEVVYYMLQEDDLTLTGRHSKVNWFRIMTVLTWAAWLLQWLDSVRRWRNPSTTILVHAMYLALVWYPEVSVSMALTVGVLYYGAGRLQRPASMETMRARLPPPVDGGEQMGNFDPFPPADVLRLWYERLSVLARKVEPVLGDVAEQGERLHALLSWTDPGGASRILVVGVCLLVAVALYAVPLKMVAVVAGFYYMRHPMFRDLMQAARFNRFRKKLPMLPDQMLSEWHR